MDLDYWLKQTPDTPLYEDILWSRPENKATSGKLTIIGGNAQAITAPGMAYSSADQAQIGVMRVVMPDAVKKSLPAVIPNAFYAPSTPSGSFAKKALGELIEHMMWADAALLSGDIGRNSETAMLLESAVQKYPGLLAVTQDAADYFKETPKMLVDREHTLIALSLAQLQRYVITTPSITPITYGMGNIQLVEALHEYTKDRPACIITKHNDLLFVACKGIVATQKDEREVWRVATAARASVFWLQNPDKIFEAAVSSL